MSEVVDLSVKLRERSISWDILFYEHIREKMREEKWINLRDRDYNQKE